MHIARISLQTITIVHIFTKHERLILLFCAAVFFVGSGLNYLMKKYPETADIINFIDSPRSHWTVNINTADQRELVAVPYIGEYTAKKILEYRAKHGPFDSIHQLKNIPGIRIKNFERFKDYVYAD
ncbi:MAG: ComEA family DNA-binding protein [Candidatus Omnitrophica bacterium]|nr:ComEA family DNA-binding protein [Candidatus Omnitrophota bacterium]